MKLYYQLNQIKHVLVLMHQANLETTVRGLAMPSQLKTITCKMSHHKFLDFYRGMRE